MTPRAILRASLTCPIDGAATYDGRALTMHETVRAAAAHVVTHGGRILAVGSAVNGGGGLTCEEERAALEEARAALG